MNITVAGVGYVGLAQAVLLAQHNAVTAVTTTPAKAEQINRGVSPIADAEIADFLRTKPLTLTATVDAERAYRTADVVIIASWTWRGGCARPHAASWRSRTSTGFIWTRTG